MTVFPDLKARLRSENRESGYVMLTSLGIIVLLLGTSLLIIGAARAQIHVAREGKAFTESRQAMDEALANAADEINTNPAYRNQFFTGAALEGSSDTRGGRSVRGGWTWRYDPATRDLRMTGLVENTEEERTLPLRTRSIASQQAGTTGGVTYGITANGPRNSGVWSAALAAATTSTVNGSLLDTPDIAMYGGATLTLSAPATANAYNAIYYSDGAKVQGGAATNTTRSKITGQFDLNRLNARVNEVTTPFCSTQTIPSMLAGAAYGCSYGNYTMTSSGLGAAGTKTMVVRGNLTIPFDLTYSGTSQLHIYVLGDVTFEQGALANATRKLRNVFIYAPAGTCKTASGVAVAIDGALACNKLDLPSNNNSFFYVTPNEDENYTGRTTSSDAIFFTESAGYVDSLSN